MKKIKNLFDKYYTKVDFILKDSDTSFKSNALFYTYVLNFHIVPKHLNKIIPYDLHKKNFI